MSTGLGVLAKAAFRIEGSEISGTGLVLSTYPLTPTLADGEEVVLGGSDMLPFLSEGVEEDYQFDYDQTLIGGSATPGSDIVAIKSAGSLELAGMYDGLDAIIGCALGFERPDLTGYSPTYDSSTALTAGVCGADTWVDSGTPFVAGDVGKFIRVKDGTGAGQVRRISGFNSTSSVTVTPGWATPTTGYVPDAADTAVMAFEFTHTFECCNNLQDQLWSDVYGSLPAGVFTANDQIIRRGTLGIYKSYQTKPWVFRSAMVNTLSFKGESSGVVTMSADFIPFDLDRDSASNTASTTWDWDNSSDVFEENERVIFSDIAFIRVADYASYTATPLTSANNMGISSFELSINNNLQADDQDATTGNYRIEPARGNMREITGSFTIPRYESDQWFDWRDAGTPLIAYIQINGTTLTNEARSLRIYINTFKLEKGSAPVGGASVLTQTFNFRALVPAATPNGFPAQTVLADNNPLGEISIVTINQNPFNVFLDQNKEY